MAEAGYKYKQDNKRIAKNTVMLYIRMLVMMVISLYTSRIVLEVLGVEDYGIYHVVGGVVSVLAFLNTSMAGATQRFLNVEFGKGDQDGARRVFVTAQVIHILVALVVVVLAETIGLWFLNFCMDIPEDRMVAANAVYQFSILTFIVTITSVPFNATIIAHERMSAFAYITVFEAVFKLIAVYLLLIIAYDKLIVYSLLISIISIVVLLIYRIYCKRKFQECRGFSLRYDKTVMRSMLGFSGWTIFGSLGSISHTQGIAIVLNYFFGVVINAAQGIALQVNGVVNHFVQNFMTALNPQIVKSYAAGDLGAMHDLLIRGSKMGYFLVLFFVVPLVAETPTVLGLWLHEVPDYTVIFVRIMLLTSLFGAFASPLSASKGATGDIKMYQIIVTTIGWLHLPLACVAFVLGAEPYYAMYIYMLLTIVMQGCRIYIVCRSIGLRIRDFLSRVIVRLLWVSVAAAVVPAVIKALAPESLWISLANMALGCVAVSLAVYALGLDEGERRKIVGGVKKKFNR